MMFMAEQNIRGATEKVDDDVVVVGGRNLSLLEVIDR